MTSELINHKPVDSPFISDEEAVKLIIDGADDALILLDPQFCVVYCNRKAKDVIFNYTGKEIARGTQMLTLANKERKEIVRAIYQDVLKGGSHSTHTEVPAEDGSMAHFENIFHPAYNTNGKITGIIITSKNVTENRKNRQAIQESEERLQIALEAAAQGVWDWNLQTNEVIYSSSYKKMYGFGEQELKNDISEWNARIHPDDKTKMQNSVKAHLSSGEPVFDSQYRIRGKDGRYRWVMAKGRIIAYDDAGNPLRMIGTHTDITEAVEKEIALKRMNERFDSMMKATHELLWEWDIDQKTVFRAEDGLRNVYGMTDDQPIRLIGNWLKRLHTDDQPTVEAKLQEILQGQHQETFEMEYRFLRDDGSYAYIYDRGIMLRDENGTPARVIGAAQDISDRKRLEKELLQTELDYQRRIHQATVDTQEKERGEIGKELHDNVNQVLTTTKLYLDLALTNSELNEELVRKSLLNINNVIQEIRHLSRSLMDPSIDDLGLTDSIKDLIENIHLTQKININLLIEDDVEHWVDATQKLTLFRIIQESLNNVLRHAKASTVAISLSKEDGLIVLLIRDNGIGFQPEKTRKGAGLKNIKNRIYLINGTLQLESSPGHGCSLKIQFPVTAQTEKIRKT
jgi:PAS domain S-box-containing protein